MPQYPKYTGYSSWVLCETLRYNVFRVSLYTMFETNASCVLVTDPLAMSSDRGIPLLVLGVWQ